jgi:5'-phosphate synthase pdxT subunit
VVAPRVGVLALQGDVVEHRRMLEAAGAVSEAVRRGRDLDDLDGLVLPGGESTTMVRLAQAFDLFDDLRSYISAGRPVYGSCAGMILLADRLEGAVEGQTTFGGIDATVRRNAFGRQVDSFETDVEIAGLDTPVHAVFIRAPRVESVGPGVEVLGTLGAGPGAGSIVAVRQDAALATSFHPELTGDPRIHRMFVEIVKGNR